MKHSIITMILNQAASLEAMEMFDKRPEVDVICGHGYRVDEAGEPYRRFRADRTVLSAGR